ncbi:MAG: flavoprotein [Faecalibacterium prausnitzii]
MSFAVQQDTRFGTGKGWRQRLQAVTGQPVLDTLQAVEPLGPRRLAQALVVAPCTGATLARLAAGLSDTPVTLAAKSLLRVGSPVVLAVSHQRRPWRLRRKYGAVVPAQALLLCALRAGRPLCQAPEPEGRPCPAARRRGRRFAG